ncbi:hypothetical protein FS594_24285 (plasmid) [Rahnella aquatilis]|nr:hypothetical protein FS594_24285 [Rahnella aquatilis]
MRRIALLLTLLIAGSAVAEDTTSQHTPATYINILCSSALNKPDGTADYFREQIKDISTQSQSPSSINKPEFNEDEADKVIETWTSLSKTDREKIRTQQQCQDTLYKRYQEG